jgi:shikimate kinase
MSDRRTKVFLSGFMGAGKSRIGRTLRDEYGIPFYDTDAVIEEKSKKSVNLIFEEEGENAFRNWETLVLKELSELEGLVIIALGGGAVLSEVNRNIMKNSGFVIYLKSSAEAIYERVKHNTHRPLLQVDDVENAGEIVLNKIKTIMNERSSYYEQADLTIERDGMEPQEVAKKIVHFLSANKDFHL